MNKPTERTPERKPAPESLPGYPRGLIDLTRLTGRDLPIVEPGRKHG